MLRPDVVAHARPTEPPETSVAKPLGCLPHEQRPSLDSRKDVVKQQEVAHFTRVALATSLAWNAWESTRVDGRGRGCCLVLRYLTEQAEVRQHLADTPHDARPGVLRHCHRQPRFLA